MVASETVVKTEHLSIELGTNVKDRFLNAARNNELELEIKKNESLPKKDIFGIKKTETLTKKDIFGIKNLNISQISTTDLEKGDISEAYAAEYSHDLNEDFSLKISGRYSPGKVIVPLMINSKKYGWGIGCEINITLDPSELRKNGFYVVVSVPICGVQCTVKYNVINDDIIVIFRAPLPDGNDDDKKGAAACGASLVCVKFDFDYHIVREKVYAYESIKHYVYNSPQTLPAITDSNTVTLPQSNVISDVVEGTGNAIAGAVEGIGNLLGSLFTRERTNYNERLVYN